MNACYINYDMGLHMHGDYDMGFACAWYDNAKVYVELFTGSPTTFLKLITWNQNHCMLFFFFSIKNYLDCQIN